MKLKRSTINSYLNVLDKVYYNDEEISFEFIYQLLTNFKQVANVIPFTVPVFFIIDYTKAQYLSLSGGVHMTLYPPQEFLEGGIDFLVHIYNPYDFKVYNEKVFNANVNFLKTVSCQEHHKYVFSYNFRFLNGAGEWCAVYQRSSYITSKQTGLPLYNIGMVSDITAFKTDTTMLHTIEYFEQKEDGFTKTLVQKNFFYPYEEDMLLTRREKEILKRMTDGLTSKEIAEKFFLSEDTIINHRKNMLRKTNTKNVAELISYCLKNKII
ncbi:MAG TPA: helix-turn-helix transcriptional regulator [Parafilimonas sp.]|nr:helix-turn-helix transcriptional regulator [Parafilimonas sp.]